MSLTYKKTILTISVHPEGDNPVFSETATHVSIDDHAGGPFLVIGQSRDDTDNGKIIVDFKEFDAIAEAVQQLKDGIDEKDFAWLFTFSPDLI